VADWLGETSEVTTSQGHLGSYSLEVDAVGQDVGQTDFSPNWGVEDAWPGQAKVTPGKDDFVHRLAAGRIRLHRPRRGNRTLTRAYT
jgi:hypothetical protein